MIISESVSIFPCFLFLVSLFYALPFSTSLVPAPSLGEEGSGTMRIPNSFCCAKILIANQILGSENVI